MNPQTPLLDDRDQSAVLSDLLHHLPGYAKNLSPETSIIGISMMRVFARYMEILMNGLNQVPNRNLLAFLDMIGTHLLPAQAARVPLVFQLMDNSPTDVTLPVNSQAAAPPQPVAPSPSSSAQATRPQPVIFATTRTITLARSQLAALYSIQPGSDEYVNHTARLTDGFTIFDDMRLTEHAIYLGHDHLFALSGNIRVLLFFTLKSGVERRLKTQWEYLTESGWLPFISNDEDDTTQGLQKDGQITLQRECGPNAKKETIHGRTSFWIRGRLTTPLLPERDINLKTIPVINDIRARLSFSKSDLFPEAAFADTVPLDISKDFYPFGQQPDRYSTFYLASKEVFQRKGAQISIVVIVPPNGGAQGTVKLEWEFYDGRTWRQLGIVASTGSGYTFVSGGTISFPCPSNWEETTINGVKNYWLRVRITEGNYGYPVHVHVNPNTKTPELIDSTLHPPVISKLTLIYTYLTDPETLDHCLSYNDFVFEDQTEACRWPDQTFKPFLPVADLQPTVHFGFDRPLPVGLLSIFVNVPQAEEDSATRETSPFVWEYRTLRGWKELGVLDETMGFQRSGMIQFIGPNDAVPGEGLGGKLYRIRARLKQGERPFPLPIAGIWLNAVWATERTSTEKEWLGMSDGNPGQTFNFRNIPVLKGEVIEVQEWTGHGEGWQTSVQGVPNTDLRFDRDIATGIVTGVWVRWYGQPHLYNSSADDRHYVIEHATGLIRFGDGSRGMIPPAGSRIMASYYSGGGITGNVPAGKISELRTVVPFIMGVTNPVPASGGADIEKTEVVFKRGPQCIRHRDRAVSPEDYEWMAREASPDVARVRCLPIVGPAGHAQRGWVTLVVVPHSQDARPQPTVEFQRRIRDYLSGRVPATLARHIRVVGPQYALVSIRTEIVPARFDEAALVEARVRDNLNRFLHPLTGGTDGNGWDFGQVVYLSQIAKIIEETTINGDIPGVDYARHICLYMNGQLFDEYIPVDEYTLIAAGDHELKLTVRED